LVVLAARLVQAEDKLAFAALGDLLEPVADDLLAELPVPQRRAITVALLREDPGGRRLDQRAIGAGTATILKVLVRTAAVVVAVDDLQWLDLSSARVLEFALRRLDGLPVGILASQRTGDQSRVPLDLERAVPHGRVTRVEVGPLSMAALHEVIKSRLGRSLPRRMPLRIEQATGGNPFFALEIARSLPEAAVRARPSRPCPTTWPSLSRRASRGCRRPHERRCWPPRRCRRPRWSSSPARSSGRGHRRWRRLSAPRRRASSGWTGPRLASRIRCSSRPSTPARRLWSGAGRTGRLAQLSDELEERARHLALAAETADEVTAAVLAEAAEHARRRGASDTAALLAEQARLLTPPDQVEDVQRRTIQAAEYQFDAGELRQAWEALEAVLEQAPVGSLRTRTLRLLGEILFHESSFPQAICLFEEALELAGDVAGAGAHARRALERAEPLGAKGAGRGAGGVGDDGLYARQWSGRGEDPACARAGGPGPAGDGGAAPEPDRRRPDAVRGQAGALGGYPQPAPGADLGARAGERSAVHVEPFGLGRVLAG